MKSKTASVVTQKKNNSFLKTFICIFLAVLIVFGATAGIIVAVRNAKSVAKSGNVYVTEGVANYFASQFKITYMATLKADQVLGVEDKESFWNKTAEDGETYGEKLAKEFKGYLSEIVAGNVLFNNYGKLETSDEIVIEKTISDTLRWRANNSKEKFNEIAEKYKFNYDDFCEAIKLLYKAERARALIYGEDGTNLDTGLAAQYFKNYTHVSLAFIRTDYKRVVNEITGAEEYVEIDSIERAERLAKIAEIKGYIENTKTGSGDMMTALTFKEILNDYEGDPSVEYYFYAGSAATNEFALDFGEVVEMAYSMENGEFEYVNCSIAPDPETGYAGFSGACFIYKTAATGQPYLTEADNTFLSDFYAIASTYYYASNLLEFAKDVEFTKLYDEKIDPVLIPKNNEIGISGWSN